MPKTCETMAALGRAVLEGDVAGAERWSQLALQLMIAPSQVIDNGLIPGLRHAGDLWEAGEYFLPELAGAAQAMKAAMKVIEPVLASDAQRIAAGRVVIGTVWGDIHDIGKSLVAVLLTANGFVVKDEGVNVPVDQFITRARELDADIICASALLTTTMAQQRELVLAVRQAGLRSKIMVGGAPVTADWAREIGADGQADNAVAAVAVAHKLMGHHHET